MRRFALLLLLAPVPGFGQSLVTIAPQDCVWHTGDDANGSLRWAAPALDESGWKPYRLRKLNPDEPRIWVRCHVDLSPLRGTARPALQLNLRAAYELFVNGSPAGAFGNMETGNYTADFVRTFPLFTPIPVQAKSAIALRIVFRGNPDSQFRFGPETDGLQWIAGDRERLQDRRNSLAFLNALRILPTTIAFFIVGIAGVMLLGLYLSDRTRPEFMYFAIFCWSIALRRILEQLVTSLYPVSLLEFRLLDACLVAAFLSYVPLVYALARKPVPWFYRCAIGLCLTLSILRATTAFVSAAQNLWMVPLLESMVVWVNVLFGVAYLSPVVAFWPGRQIKGAMSVSMRSVVAALMVWAVANEVFIAFLLSRNFSVRSVASFVNTWWPVVQQARATLMITAIVVLLVLLFQDQRKTAKERAQLAGEMDAAREVQQQLVPASIPQVAGFEIAAAYLPAAEVGGDFYQVLPLADGATLIVVGDVSGKGLKAAMAVSLIVGVLGTLVEAEGQISPRPAEILAGLNRRLHGRLQGGFATCLVMLMDADGGCVIANAGHLPSFLNGVEVTVLPSLPLGLAPAMEYESSELQMGNGDRLMLYTDGVLEARAADGALLGFERMAELSVGTAAAIAQAAQAFGQDDDITVLTVRRVPECA